MLTGKIRDLLTWAKGRILSFPWIGRVLTFRFSMLIAFAKAIFSKIVTYELDSTQLQILRFFGGLRNLRVNIFHCGCARFTVFVTSLSRKFWEIRKTLPPQRVSVTAVRHLQFFIYFLLELRLSFPGTQSCVTAIRCCEFWYKFVWFLIDGLIICCYVHCSVATVFFVFLTSIKPSTSTSLTWFVFKQVDQQRNFIQNQWVRS